MALHLSAAVPSLKKKDAASEYLSEMTREENRLRWLPTKDYMTSNDAAVHKFK
jgi:hypothetical protein